MPRLHEDMNLWLVGGGGKVQAVVILRWQRVTDSNKVRGSVELYTLDQNGIPRLDTEIEIFPSPPAALAATQQLTLTRRQVFGDHVPPGQNPNSQFPFLINPLRIKAREALQMMGLVPA